MFYSARRGGGFKRVHTIDFGAGYPRLSPSLPIFYVILSISPRGRLYGSRYLVARPGPSAYVGPPTERHSVAAVIVGRGTNDELSPSEVSGFVRVQQAVGKRSIVATAPLATEDTASTSASASAGTEAGATLAATSVDEARLPGVSSQERAGARREGKPATRAPTMDDGVRYVTLRFHSVSSRA